MTKVQREWNTLFETNVDLLIVLESGEKIEERVRMLAQREETFVLEIPSNVVSVILDPKANLLFEGQVEQEATCRTYGTFEGPEVVSLWRNGIALVSSGLFPSATQVCLVKVKLSMLTKYSYSFESWRW